jgi:hypothetical protein
MKALRSVVAMVALALALVAIPHAAPAAPTLLQLRGVQEIKSWFNTYTGRPRLILLLSPT